MALLLNNTLTLAPLWVSRLAAESAIGVSDNINVECSEVHRLNSSERCAFVNSTHNCHVDAGLIDYTIFVYCEFKSQLVPLAITILFFWLLFLFVALAITADNFFCPSLVVLAKTMRMTDNIAFGNGAPDVFSAMSAVSNMKNGDVGLVFGALLGAGVFLTTVVVGAVCLVGPFHAMERPFLRDLVFYIVTVGGTFVICWDGEINLVESLFYFIAYFVYVAVVVIGRLIYQWQKRRRIAELLSTAANQAPENGTGDTGGSRRSSLAQSRASLGNVPEEPVSASDDEDEEHAYERRPSLTRNVVNQPGLLLNGGSGESTPLLQQPIVSTVARRRGPFNLFLRSIAPIDAEDWRSLGIFAKCYAIFRAPALFIIMLTTPVVDYSNPPMHNWNKPLQMIHCVITPIFVIFAANSQTALTRLGGVFYVWLLFLLAGLILAIIVFFTSQPDKPPIYHPVFAYVGFVAAVMWIKMIANEIVNLLQTGGVVFHLSTAVLGLTFLAWGNSIGDFISDVAMARRGFPRTGISACFGGPLFNTLLGVGIPFTIKIISEKQPVIIEMSDIQMVLFAGLAASLVSTLIVVPLLRFRLNWIYGICLIALYVVFLLIALLVELHVIQWEI